MDNDILNGFELSEDAEAMKEYLQRFRHLHKVICIPCCALSADVKVSVELRLLLRRATGVRCNVSADDLGRPPNNVAEYHKIYRQKQDTVLTRRRHTPCVDGVLLMIFNRKVLNAWASTAMPRKDAMNHARKYAWWKRPQKVIKNMLFSRNTIPQPCCSFTLAMLETSQRALRLAAIVSDVVCYLPQASKFTGEESIAPAVTALQYADALIQREAGTATDNKETRLRRWNAVDFDFTSACQHAPPPSPTNYPVDKEAFSGPFAPHPPRNVQSKYLSALSSVINDQPYFVPETKVVGASFLNAVLPLALCKIPEVSPRTLGSYTLLIENAKKATYSSSTALECKLTVSSSHHSAI